MASTETGSDKFINTTTATAFIPEQWSKDAIVARKQRTVFAMNVNKQYKNDLKVGDIVNVPSVNHLSAARTKTTRTAITYDAITEDTTQITVSTHNYAAIAVESLAKLQSNVDQQRLYADEMGYALDLAVDDALAALVDAFTQNVGTLAADLSYDDLLDAIQYLDDANAPQDGRLVIASPASHNNFAKLDKFINADYAILRNGGSGQTSDSSKGFIGSWMGMPFFKTTNVDGTNAAGHDNVMMHNEALAMIQQMEPTFESMRDTDYLVDKIAAQQVYGVKEMRDDHGVWMKGK